MAREISSSVEWTDLDFQIPVWASFEVVKMRFEQVGGPAIGDKLRKAIKGVEVHNDVVITGWLRETLDRQCEDFDRNIDADDTED